MTPGAFLTPWYLRNGDGVLLATIGALVQGQDEEESLYRSTDGCDWAPAGGTRGDVVTAIAFDPSDDDVALAVSGDVAAGATNGIKRSVDGGATFAATSHTDVPDRIFRSVVAAGGGTTWATATWFNPLGAWVYRSTDGGATWEENVQDIQDAGEPQILMDVVAADPTDPLVAWIRVDGQLEDRLMRTDDGGVTFAEVFRAEGDFADVLREPAGAIWVAMSPSGLFRAADGVTFAEVVGAPAVKGLAQDARGVHLALSGGVQDPVIATTTDGSTFETVMGWGDLLGPLECAEGTDAATFCDPNWGVVELALGRGGDDDDSAIGDDDDSAGVGEGCCPEEASIAAGDTGGGVFALAVLAVTRRRRVA